MTPSTAPPLWKIGADTGMCMTEAQACADARAYQKNQQGRGLGVIDEVLDQPGSQIDQWNHGSLGLSDVRGKSGQHSRLMVPDISSRLGVPASVPLASADSASIFIRMSETSSHYWSTFSPRGCQHPLLH